MQVDFVRVPAEVPGRCYGCAHYKPGVPSAEHCNTVNGVKQGSDNDCYSEGMGHIWKAAPKVMTCKLSAHKAEYRARPLDPATSKGKRKVNKYEQAVLTALAGAHHTGQEIAQVTGQPLNCVTPRFAPLRRKGLIKDSGVKRNKQTVWCLA